jgi:pyruvate dehydrogenase E2 component (dihydrolipoamide acetyltransferase)
VASLLRVPEVAAGATEAVLSEWLVEERTAVTADQPIVVIETDKATVEVPAGADAVLLRRLVTGGQPVEVGSPMALVGDGSEADGDLDQILSALGVPAAAPRAGSGAPPPTGGDGDRPPLGSVSAAPEPETAPEGTVAGPADDLPVAAPPAPGGNGGQGDRAAGEVQDDRTGPRRVFASPLARRILSSAGLGTDGIAGSGPGGRIVRRDAEAAVREGSRTAPAAPAATPIPEPAPEPAPQPPATSAGQGYEEVPHTRVRRAIAARLTASKQTVPHFYVKRTARIDALLDLRRQLNEVSPQKISVNDLLLRAVAVAHTRVPEANAVWTDDAVRVFDSVDVAVAIASQRGLVTPVLRDVQRTSPAAIAAQVRDYVRRADEGRLAQRDLEGGSIAVTNLGMYGVEEFAAIINPPQSAILAVGAGVAAPVVVDGSLAVATVMTLVLSVDHRVIDGALAARWMDALVTTVEQPLRLLA